MSERIVLVTKSSTYQGWKKTGFIDDLSHHTAFYQKLLSAHEEHCKSIDMIIAALNELKVHYTVYDRESDYRDLENSTLVIAAGGDGTFIHCSHFLKSTPLIGINTAPSSSVGHYSELDFINRFENSRNILHKVINQSVAPVKFERLKIAINEEILNIPVLNDILITDTNPASTCRYILELNQTQELQKSSGIWIATAHGATAAYSSAGGTPFQERNDKGERQFAFIVREPYEGKNVQLKNHTVSETASFSVSSVMPHGRIYCDGNYKTREFLPGRCLKISFSETPLFAFRDIEPA